MATPMLKRYGHPLLLVGILGLSLLAPTRAADQPRPQVSAADLPGLAQSGKFGDVLTVLRQQPVADAQVASLVQDIQRYQTHEADRTAKRREAHDKAFKAMLEKWDAGKLDEALADASQARGLADDAKAFLRNPKVEALYHKAEQTAQVAEQEGDWIEALSLYRTMDSSYEEVGEPGQYRDQTKRAERHVRLLRMYAPEEFKRLYTERTKRLGLTGKKAEPLVLGEETWKDELKDVELTMLRQTLAHAARRHVANGGYVPLLKGAIDALVTFTDAKALVATFPALVDAAQRDAFRAALQGFRKEVTDKPDDVNFLTASRIVDDILQTNQQTLKLDERVLVYELADGAMSALDEFSNVIWPREKNEFSRNTQGKFGGIGVQISRRDGRLVVMSPLEGTPAQRAGIKAGDVIASVNGRSTAGWSLDQAVREITGEKGTQVTVGIERTGKVEPLSFAITRAEIIIESVRGWQHKPGGGWDFYLDPGAKIGYVRVTQFLPQTAGDLDAAVNDMENAGGLRALILDLRLNPGGLLTSAIEVSNRFIREGTIVSTVDHTGRVTSEARARADHSYAGFPVVVLVNEASASASEIVAGAVQDYGRATIVGTRSFGKGSVQDLFPIDNDKAYLKLTTQYYRLPKGRIIHRKPGAKDWGIDPDLQVKMTAQQITDLWEFRQDVDVLRDPKDPAPAGPDVKPAPMAAQILEKGLDPQLETALLLLKTRLVADKITVARSPAPPAEAAR